MRVVVIEAPEPIITPRDVPGDHDGDDSFVMAMIMAAQAQIDGPAGWLGRALGVQTLEVHSDCWLGSLPYRPVIEVISASVGSVAVQGVSSAWDGVLGLEPSLPRGNVVIRYRAGYDDVKTGRVPYNAKAAVMLMVQELKAQASASGGLRSVTVDDVMTHAFNSPDMVQRARTAAVEALLMPLRIYG